MENKELQNVKLSAYVPATLNFKSDALKAYTLEIAKIGTDVADRAVKLCKVFGNIALTKCYEDDGFKSVADYAMDVFGIAKSQAYQFANVGKRFYLNDDMSDKVQAITETCPPSKLAEIVNMTDEQIEQSGIDGTETQAQLRDTSKRYKTPSKPKVEKLMDIAYYMFTGESAYSQEAVATKGCFALDMHIDAYEQKSFSDGTVCYYDAKSNNFCIAHFTEHKEQKLSDSEKLIAELRRQIAELKGER